MPGTGASLRVTTISSDAVGRPSSIVYPDASEETFHYDTFGRLTSQVDVVGREYMFFYEADGSLSKAQFNATSGVVSTSVEYDQQMNTLRICDQTGRVVAAYTLDGQDRAIAVTNVEGQTMTIDYWFGDMVKAITRYDGTIVSNTYNAAGLLSKFNCPMMPSCSSTTPTAHLRV